MEGGGPMSTARVVSATAPEAGISRREARLRTSAILVLLGIAIEAASFVRVHPLAFLIFLGLGGLSIAAGIVMYLLALLEADRASG